MPARAAPTFYGDDMTVPEQVCWAGTGGYAMVNFSFNTDTDRIGQGENFSP
jgi:hypothetical protein